MRNTYLSMSLAGVLLAATLASAQPPSPVEPARPQPQDPTPVPDPKPPIAKPTPEPQTPAPAGRIGGDSELVVSGCLQRAAVARDAAGQASPESREGGSLAGGFVLKQASAKPAGGDAPSTAAGTKEYRIVAAGDAVKLAEHVGHQVQVTGRVTVENAPPSPSGTESSQSSSKPSGSTGVSVTPPPTGAAAPAVTLSVSSLKMVASTCSAPAL